jgi:hypothetical protein
LLLCFDFFSVFCRVFLRTQNMVKHLLFILFLFFSLHCFCQIDSAVNKSISVKTDSLSKNNIPQKPLLKDSSTAIAIDSTADSAKISARDSLRNGSEKIVSNNEIHPAVAMHLSWQQDTLFTNLFKFHFISKNVKAIIITEEERKVDSKDILFYTLAGLVFFLAVIKISFPKYFMNIFRSFLEAGFRQKQSREVLLQNNLPSLLTNILFFLTAGLFIALVSSKHTWINISFWWLYLYCAILLFCVYGGKFLFILFSGWVFRAKEAAGNYIFIVFLVNKVLGIMFIPLLLLLAFADLQEANVIITVCGSVCILLLLYRYIMILSFLRSKLKINPFHFFIYLCTVEILPMLIIYKVLFNKINIVF